MNNTTLIIQLVLPIMSGLMAILVMVIGWLGSKIYGKLELMSGTLISIDRELRDDISIINNRVTRLETMNDVHNLSSVRFSRSTDIPHSQ